MIHITPGHEKSISLEILFKTLRMLPKKTHSHLMLHARKQELSHFFRDYKIPHAFGEDYLQIASDVIPLKYFPETSSNSKSFAQMGLESALEHLNPASDILFTLPTSKNSLILNGKATGGYTEYLRQKYHLPHLCMGFKNKNRIFLLLTDHIPLREVPSELAFKLIETKISASLKQIEDLFGRPKEVYLSGINPHAGEQGLLGHEEGLFSFLSKHENPRMKAIKGPLPGDTLHFYFKDFLQVFIYAFHDQALALFKEKYGLMAMQMTLGLNFLRLSVDHGTAFELYGENQANPMGCYHALLEALRLQKV